MARRSRMSMLKRQRELRKNEKAARKRAKKHGTQEEYFTEPQPTVLTSGLTAVPDSEDESDDIDSEETVSPLPEEPAQP